MLDGCYERILLKNILNIFKTNFLNCVFANPWYSIWSIHALFTSFQNIDGSPEIMQVTKPLEGQSNKKVQGKQSQKIVVVIGSSDPYRTEFSDEGFVFIVVGNNKF